LKQRYLSFGIFILLLLSIVALPGCGGGSDASTQPDNTVATVSVNPSSLSLEFGQVRSLSATATNAAGTALPQSFTFSSGNTAVVQVSPAGNVCAGAWDTAFVVCTPATTPGTTSITVTASGKTATVPVNTHRRVASVTVTSTGVPCTSQTQTQQFTAQVFAADGTDITNTVGPINWATGNPDVATLSTTGLATAKRPGAASITAIVNNVVSISAQMITCPPASITLKEKDSNPAVTAFTLNAGEQKTVAATAIDTLGNPITDIVLTYSSSQSSMATVAQTGIVAGVSPGKAAIVASCTPPSCNPGLNTPVYSNLVTVSVNGNSTGAAYATGANSTTIVPIDAATNTAGTPITIPTITISGTTFNPLVNSVVFAPDGNNAYVGTDRGLHTLGVTNNTLTFTLNLPGKVLAVSPDGTRVLISNVTAGLLYAVNPVATPAPTAESFSIPNATAAGFSPDGLKAYIVSGSTIYVYSPALGLTSFTVSSAVNDVAVLTQGNYSYFAGDVGSTISTRATCNNAALTALATAQKPLLLETVYDSSHVFGTDGANLYDVTVGPTTAPCPPPAPAQSLTTASYGVASTPGQLIVLPDGSKTYLTNSTAQLLVYAPGVGTSAINLAAGTTASTTGGATSDGKSVYVGALGTNDVQKVDTASGVVIQIPVNLKDKNGVATTPDIVVVRPK
jgi:trimeric autotransporter adhesin